MNPLRLVKMRRARDCGVASFATLLNLPYEDAAEAIITANGPLGKGLYMTSLMRAAERLGMRLIKVRKYDPEEAEGILWVSGPGIEHFVVLTEGKIYDPQDVTLWDVEDYLRVQNCKAKTLLVLDAPSTTS